MHASAIVTWSDPATPLRWGRTFPGTPQHVRLAREFVSYLLGDTPIVEDAVLAVSELAANAVQHSRTGQRGGAFTVQVRRWTTRATVSITDDGNRLTPVADPRHQASDRPHVAGDLIAEDGRGLAIVRSVAQSLSRRGSAEGRTYTAEFSW